MPGLQPGEGARRIGRRSPRKATTTNVESAPEKVDQTVEETTSGRFVRAERERLLELIDDEERRRTGSSTRLGSASGSAPGRITTTEPPRSRRTAGMRPALMSDDFPLPDAPTTAMNPSARTRATVVATTASRPKNTSPSSGWNAIRPR